MQDESSSGYGRAGSAAPSSDAAATLGSRPGRSLGSVSGSFIPVRGRSPVVTRIVLAQVVDGGGRHATVLESVLGATPQEFESPILRGC
jgi:hypothetical protein